MNILAREVVNYLDDLLKRTFKLLTLSHVTLLSKHIVYNFIKYIYHFGIINTYFNRLLNLCTRSLR